ncbi:F-box protein PP2-A12 [Linum perenne]
MGVNWSSIFMDPVATCSLLGAFPFSAQQSPPPPPPLTPTMGDLPESCVATVLANLDPLDICRLAKLNRAFREASWADFVWESKLPTNYRTLMEKVLGVDVDVNKMGKREIYTRLCFPNSYDAGTKVAWLDTTTGGVCVSIASKGLTITGIDDRRYWNHVPSMESRFSSVAYLQQIWWFEVSGEFEFPFPAGTYSLFFRLQLGRTARRFGRKICNTEDVHGWDRKPVRFEMWASDGQYASSQCILNDTGKWNLYHAGDFIVEEGKALTTKLRFSMTQIDCTHTKGGLCLDTVLVSPCKFRERLNYL